MDAKFRILSAIRDPGTGGTHVQIGKEVGR